MLLLLYLYLQISLLDEGDHPFLQFGGGGWIERLYSAFRSLGTVSSQLDAAVGMGQLSKSFFKAISLAFWGIEQVKESDVESL